MPESHKEHLRGLLDNPRFTDNVNRQAWQCLVKWYKEEEENMGEFRAFWGVVYRILDKPTLLDLECIRGYMIQQWNECYLAPDISHYPSWWDGFWPD